MHAPRRTICQLMYIHARTMGRNANEPYSADDFAMPTCATAHILTQAPKRNAVTNPPMTASRNGTFLFGSTANA